MAACTLDVDCRGGGLGHRHLPSGRAVGQRGGGARHVDLLADKIESGGVLCGLLQRDQGAELGVGFELLLDLRERHELRGELVGVERREWVLVLELRGQQGQEGLEISRQRRTRGRGEARARGVLGRKRCRARYDLWGHA